jgi:hypothetical protein
MISTYLIDASWTAQSAPWFAVELPVPVRLQQALPHVHPSHGGHPGPVGSERVPKGRNNLEPGTGVPGSILSIINFSFYESRTGSGFNVSNLSDLHEGCIVKLPFVTLYEIELAGYLMGAHYSNDGKADLLISTL